MLFCTALIPAFVRARPCLIIYMPATSKPATKILICTMTSNNIMKRICALIPAAAVMLRALAFAPSITCADTYVSDFQTSFDGWQQQWHNESETGTPGFVSHSTERGYNDGASLKFDMGDGFGDDGTLWIEKMFSIDAGVPTNIAVAFQQFNEFQSDFNTFQVKAAVSIQNPNEQADFTTIGNTDSGEGWVPFEYDRLITSPTGEVWVALGIRVAWEGHRDYWIDHVAVTTTAIPEPSAMILLLIAVTTVLTSGRTPGVPLDNIAQTPPTLRCLGADRNAGATRR